MIKIGAGHKSEVFALPDGGVLKLFVPEFVSLAPVELEISRVLERAGVQAPRVDRTVVIDDRPGIVFGNLRVGETLSTAIRAKPWQIVSSARNLAKLHAAVHDCASAELPSQRERLEAEILASAGLSAEARGAALRTLASLPDGDAVCHNDIHMLNVIVYEGGSMIIDWVLATRGNPLADVASAVLQLRFGEQPRGLAGKLALDLGRAAFARVYRRRYLELRPGRQAELQRWELPVAAALAGRREGRMRRQLLARIDSLAGTDRSRSAVQQS